MTEKYFDFDRYIDEIIILTSQYDLLEDFVSDEDAIRAKLANEPWSQSVTSDYVEGDIMIRKATFRQALDLLGNQMVVYCWSLIDAIVEKFFLSIFVSKPELVKILANSKDYKEFKDKLGFSLNGFLASESKEAYVYELSKKAADLCVQGGPDKFSKKIRLLTGSQFSEEDIKALNDIYHKRNKIVHDNEKYELSTLDLRGFYLSLYNVLCKLHKELSDLGIVDKRDYLRLVMVKYLKEPLLADSTGFDKENSD
ncbi:hypothetical protein CXK86_11345 [Paenibacillus sp. BGI2013]|uniref:hypothetical protein n=1 Tax=Paenibacillus sp. BGI2013 TaxID=2058902 RepID=UPI000C6EC306|nr:hypothetical protein [Paenibacillus sp. BGI2013]PKQ90634.1 hypothetical protein CXK86_11345 [Paenibacillus sp. BGI2013]